jgi:hypothetical protein
MLVVVPRIGVVLVRRMTTAVIVALVAVIVVLLREYGSGRSE